MSNPMPPATRHLLFLALAAILIIRLFSLGAYPLTDTTEARYGEIVRKMVELGDWVTLWFDYGTPFWGKPPLAFWLSAISAKVLGLSEFALRLPSFLLGLGMLGLVGGIARRPSGDNLALIAILVLASSSLFFVASGAVLTDTTLAFSVTLSMVAFWRGVVDPQLGAVGWRYLLFAALGLGLLSKGPVALILSSAPIFAWAVLRGRLWQSLHALPWAGGLALMLLIALPWYLLAEQRTPGFLDYFLAGENFRRFTDPAWSGDRYGSVHTRPWGYIWLLWLLATAPWSIKLPFIAVKCWRQRHTTAPPESPGDSGWRTYLLCFALAPGLFFTFAGSVLWTYVLPGLPALALLIADRSFAQCSILELRRLAGIAVVLPLLFALALPQLGADKSQRALLAHAPPEVEMIYFPTRPFSAQFYSAGRARRAANLRELRAAIASAPDRYLSTPANVSLPSWVADRYRLVARAGQRREWLLWAPKRDRHNDLPDRPASEGAADLEFQRPFLGGAGF